MQKINKSPYFKVEYPRLEYAKAGEGWATLLPYDLRIIGKGWDTRVEWEGGFVVVRLLKGSYSYPFVS